jgi:hypothetical protein
MLLGHAAPRIRRAMKKKPPPQELPDDKAATPAPEDPKQADAREGRSGEGAHSAMKHWLNEERNRLKRPER